MEQNKIEHLQLLIKSGWRGQAGWLARRWALQSLRDLPEFDTILMTLRNEPDK